MRRPLSRAPLRRGDAVLRSLLLLFALTIAATPLALLFDDGQWLRLTVIAGVTVIGGGMTLRLIRPGSVLVPIGQVLLAGAVLLAVQSSTGLLAQLDPDGAPSVPRILTGQPALVMAGIAELADGYAPVSLEPAGFVLMLLLMMLVALILDLSFSELQWHTATALILLAFPLAPALMQPAGGPWWGIAGPVGAALLILATRTVHEDAEYPPRTGRSSPQLHARRAGLRAVTVLGIVAVLALGPALLNALPRQTSPYSLSIDTLNELQGRTTPGMGPQMISEEVSVRRDLMRAQETEVLRLETEDPDPDYLRLRALTRFDGEAWSGRDGDQPENLSISVFSDRPTSAEAAAAEDEDLIYDISVTSLATDRLPAPSAAGWTSLQSPDNPREAGRSNGELVLRGGSRDVSGETYQVERRAVPYTEDDLRAVEDEDLALPFLQGYIQADPPARVAAYAAEVREDAGAEGAFATARAFERAFHSDFTYDLTARTAPGENPIDAFLDERTGYCEQYAATFALMMIAEGYPARVVIGFTSGQATGEGERVITNHNAHAWPEVWFGPEYGWVRFEPTPAGANAGLTRTQLAADEPAEMPEGATVETPDAPEGLDTPPDGDPAGEEPEPQAPGEEAGSEADSPDVAEEETGAPAGAGPLPWIVLGGAALGVVGLVLARIRRTAVREGRWRALAGSSADGRGAGGGGDGEGKGDGGRAGAGEGDGGGAGEGDGDSGDSGSDVRIGREAALLAWADVQEAVRRRDRAVHWWGWTGWFGPDPGELTLDEAQPPRRALADLLTAQEARGIEVTAEDRESAAALGGAVTAARYAPTGDGARGGGGAVGRDADGNGGRDGVGAVGGAVDGGAGRDGGPAAGGAVDGGGGRDVVARRRADADRLRALVWAWGRTPRRGVAARQE